MGVRGKKSDKTLRRGERINKKESTLNHIGNDAKDQQLLHGSIETLLRRIVR